MLGLLLGTHQSQLSLLLVSPPLASDPPTIAHSHQTCLNAVQVQSRIALSMVMMLASEIVGKTDLITTCTSSISCFIMSQTLPSLIHLVKSCSALDIRWQWCAASLLLITPASSTSGSSSPIMMGSSTAAIGGKLPSTMVVLLDPLPVVVCFLLLQN